MRRFYLSELVGDGMSRQTAYQPVVRVLLPNRLDARWSTMDARTSGAARAGRMVCARDVTDEEHALLVADTRVQALAAVPVPTGGWTSATVWEALTLAAEQERVR